MTVQVGSHAYILRDALTTLVVYKRGSGAMGARDESKVNLPKRRPTIKVGKNEPCSCGSGKKFKNCHGQDG